MLSEIGAGSLALMGLSRAVLNFVGPLTSLLSSDYLPHRYCYLAKPGLIWTNVITDTLIALSYSVIFAGLIWLAIQLRRSPELKEYLWILFSFAIFIVACAATHVMEVVTVWWPVYPLAAAMKVLCGLASIPTAILFARTTPKLATGVTRFIRLDSELRSANQELRQLSTRDALTTLSNRGNFDSVLASEWHRAVRSGIPLALLLMDIDHFKKLNDRYGHLVGDECLRLVGQVLSERRGRTEDLVARYGGEEFALILPGSDVLAALEIAEEIRHAVESMKIPNEDSPVSHFVTMSIGVASHIPQPADVMTDLLAASDSALYRAKYQGRNRSEAACGLDETIPMRQREAPQVEVLPEQKNLFKPR